MYEKQISQIANILAINLQMVKRTGIVEGSLGIAIFLYEYSSFSGHDSYAKMADEIIEYSIDKYLPKTERPFSFGIYGFGWALHYLEEKGYIELEEDAFSDIDKLTLLKYSQYDMISDTKAPFPLFSLGLYCIKQNNNILKEKSVDALKIIKSEKKLEEYDACYVMSIIYFLRKCINLNIKKEECLIYLNYYLEIIIRIVKKGNFRGKDVYIMQKMLPLNDITKEIQSLKVDSIKDVFCNWQTVIYSDLVEIDRQISLEALDDYMKGITCDLPDAFLGLNGLSSLGINLIRKDLELKYSIIN